MLVRLFSREHVDILLSNKSHLNGTDYVLFEDATQISRKLLNTLKKHPKIESAWIANGTIWAKKLSGGSKFKVSINDNLEMKS
jgi:hypothetical protein